MSGRHADGARRALGLGAASIVHAALVAAVPLTTASGRANLAAPRTLLFFAILTGWFLSESAAAPAILRSHPRRWLDQATAPLLLVVFWIGLAQPDTIAAPQLASVIGAVLMALGAGVRFLAIRTLGGQFLDDTDGMPDQTLVTGGVYGLMRHPSESGTLCLAVGASLLFASAAGMVITTTVLLPAVLRRIGAEDRALAAAHGTRFASYMRVVPALRPTFRPRTRPSGTVA